MNIFDKLSNVGVMVVGDVMLDRYWWGSVTRISPEAPVPVVRLERSSFAPGGAANVAVNVAGLGANVVLIGAVGRDADAELIQTQLRDSNVSPSFLLSSNGRPTTVKTRIIAHSQQVVRVDQESNDNLTAIDEEELLALIRNKMSDVDVVVVSDYAKGVVSEALMSGLIALARAENKSVVVDPKGKDYSRYRGSSLVTPNRREAAEACNLDDQRSDLVERAGRQLLAEHSFGSILITLGEAGMALFQNGSEPIYLPAMAKEVYDVTGAGDTVVATLGAAIGAGADLVSAARMANVAAGVVVEKVGTSAITAETLRAALGNVG